MREREIEKEREKEREIEKERKWQEGEIIETCPTDKKWKNEIVTF